jgi:hypothetical protein
VISVVISGVRADIDVVDNCSSRCFGQLVCGLCGSPDLGFVVRECKEMGDSRPGLLNV